MSRILMTPDELDRVIRDVAQRAEEVQGALKTALDTVLSLQNAWEGQAATAYMEEFSQSIKNAEQVPENMAQLVTMLEQAKVAIIQNDSDLASQMRR